MKKIKTTIEQANSLASQMPELSNTLSKRDLIDLERATHYLEHPSLAARLSSVIGTPVDIAIKLMPRPMYQKVRGAADTAVGNVLRVAVSSLRHDKGLKPKEGMYCALAAGTGAIGGFFGIYGLPFDLAVNTTLMLRSIAEIARAEGEHVTAADTQLACLEVFALGGHSESDDAAETGYYSIRFALSLPMTHAARHIALHGVNAEGPMLTKLIHSIGSRFGVAVSQKTAAQMIPVIGATTGATINLVFMRHFQDMARGHFVVRRLERKYGIQLIKDSYEAICQNEHTRN